MGLWTQLKSPDARMRAYINQHSIDFDILPANTMVVKTAALCLLLFNQYLTEFLHEAGLTTSPGIKKALCVVDMCKYWATKWFLRKTKPQTNVKVS